MPGKRVFQRRPERKCEEQNDRASGEAGTSRCSSPPRLFPCRFVLHTYAPAFVEVRYYRLESPKDGAHVAQWYTFKRGFQNNGRRVEIFCSPVAQFDNPAERGGLVAQAYTGRDAAVCSHTLPARLPTCTDPSQARRSARELYVGWSIQSGTPKMCCLRTRRSTYCSHCIAGHCGFGLVLGRRLTCHAHEPLSVPV